jgi:hypothetical protein
MTNGAGSANFAGSLNSAASTTYRLEFFASSALDASGYGEGQRYLGFTNVTTNASGHAVFGATLAVALTAGEWVTATATSPTNDTSEFGVGVQAVGSLVVTTTADTVDGVTTSVSNLIANPGPDGRFSLREVLQATNAVAGADSIRFGIPLTDANHVYYANDGIAASLTNIQATTLADVSTPSSATIGGYDPDYPAGAARSWYRISLTSALPVVTDTITLDGTTQPFSIGGAGPVIELNGAGAAGTVNGLYLTTSGSTIRGLVIDRFSDNGIRIDGGVGNVVAGNYIGTDVTGKLDHGNGDDGIDVRAGATNTLIGGTTAADRNVVSGNNGEGVQITEAGTSGTLVRGNYVGLDVTGTVPVPNSSFGVLMGTDSSGTTVGGTAAGSGNVISGNSGSNVRIQNDSSGNVVLGNIIGLAASGLAPVVNGANGISIVNGATNNTIGGTAAGAGNRISGNDTDGIRVLDATTLGNSFLGNSIYANGTRGIDFNNDGVTPNDSLDVDTGPNDLLNFPLLTAIYPNAGTLTTHFQLDVPAGSYRIEFFKNPLGGDETGFGEGQVFAGFVNVTHPGGGPVFFSHAFPGVVGDLVTATATRCTNGALCTAFGSTSEFAKNMNVVTTAVTLLSFEAVGRAGAVDLSWTTASELSNLGFHLYRAEAAGGPYTRITASLIPGLGSSPTGRSYDYRDSGLVNGRTYHYQLEDVESTGRTERHGPVSATPVSAGSGTDGGPTGTAYGDPSGVILREIERDSGHVLLELLTPGFVAVPAEDGRVRLSIPGFTSTSEAGEPDVPARRAFVEAVAGRKVRLTSVSAQDEVRFTGLRPKPQGLPAVEANDDGTVRPSEEKRREGRAFHGVFPQETASLLGTSFQGEQKKAEVLLFPLRWDGSGLVLSRRLVVRLDFVGREPGETSLGGSRGRRATARPRPLGQGLAAQLVAKERGLQALAYEEVFADRTRGVAADRLRVSRHGEDVAFHVEPDSTRFASGSTLYFLSPTGPSGDEVYELETGVQGTRMPVDPPTKAQGAIVEYDETVGREENRYYQPGLLHAPDLWLWDVIVSPGQTSYTFEADRVSATGAGRVSISLQGASDFDGVVDHHVRVRVNGTYVGEATWDGKEPESLDLEIGPGVLHDGTNVLGLENVGDTGAAYSLVFLNRFSVRYPRALVASGGKLEGGFAATGRATVESLAASAVVLDTTGTPRWRTGATPTATGLSFPVEAGHRYLATSVLHHPLVRSIQGRWLQKTENRADYLLLAPRVFLPAAQPLLEHRQGEGLATKGVALEDVYEQFGHGEASPEAIKAFLEYAYHSWTGPSVRYAVLLGDASYDPKGYLGTGVKDWLPGVAVKTTYLWTVSDPGYASVNGEDLVPDIAIGRLPAGSVDEARRLVEKVIGYENGGGRLDGPAVLVADNADLGGNFEADADEIASGVLQGRDVRKVYYSQQGAGTRAAIKQAFDAGASLVSYVGHGATAVWASENIFNDGDVASLQAQPQQPFLMTMNCLNGFFHFPPMNSLAEELLKAEGKGVVGAFSPSGLSMNGPAHVYHEALLEEIVSGRHARIGDAILAAQERYAASGAMPELLSLYHLLGDPALSLR